MNIAVKTKIIVSAMIAVSFVGGWYVRDAGARAELTQLRAEINVLVKAGTDAKTQTALDKETLEAFEKYIQLQAGGEKDRNELLAWLKKIDAENQASYKKVFGVPQKEEYHAPVDHLGW